MTVLAGAEPVAVDGGPVGVLVCHGFTGTTQSIRPWAEHLASAGLTVAAPRLPGHGTRWQDLNATGWDDWYGEVERTFDDLRGRCDTVFAMGLSMGGMIAQTMAIEHPRRVRSLTSIMSTTGRRSVGWQHPRLLPVLLGAHRRRSITAARRAGRRARRAPHAGGCDPAGTPDSAARR